VSRWAMGGDVLAADGSDARGGGGCDCAAGDGTGGTPSERWDGVPRRRHRPPVRDSRRGRRAGTEESFHKNIMTNDATEI
jgi:hypothetical protein